MKLVAVDPVYIDDMQLYPDLATNSVDVRLKIDNRTKKPFEGKALLTVSGNGLHVTKEVPVGSEAEEMDLTETVALGREAKLWDEFNPNLYTVECTLLTGTGKESFEHKKSATFGMREVAQGRNHILLNGRPLHLRGTVENAVFPKTGHAPVCDAEWERIMRIVKDYGLNHIRFHSWCPPAAAFRMADRHGVYLEVEMPMWGKDAEPDEARYHVKELSRREMFEQVSHGSKSGTKKLLQMLPGLHSEDDGGVDFRLLLHQRTKQLKASMETPLKYGYYLPNFTDKCFGCGKCEKACRAGALKLEDLPDGQTRIVITPWKCSECEVCVASCSNHGIDGMKLRQLTTLGPVSVHKCTKTLCKECGKPIAPGSVDGVCTVCRIKARTKKRQEEAAARAKQLREEREAKKAAEEAAKAAAEAGADAAETAVQMAAAPAETAAAAAVPAAAGSVITALTPEKTAPAALNETPAAAPENTAEKDVPDTPKND